MTSRPLGQLRELCLLLLLGLAAQSDLAAGEVPYNRAYPGEAFLVPLAERGRLQQYLDQYGVIRLEPGDYQQGNPGPLHLRSGNRIYGLNNGLPTVVVEPGTAGAVLSCVHTQLKFPPSPLVTQHNLFTRVTYTPVTVDGAVLEENLFLNASYQSWKVDTTKQGYLRGNRIIKFLSHGGTSSIEWFGDTGRRSGGNVFLWMNLLDPKGCCTDFANLSDLSLIFLDCESYAPAVDVAIRARGIGRLTLFGAGGLMHNGRVVDADVDALYLQGHHLGTMTPPTVLLRANTKSAVMIDCGEKQEVRDEAKDALRLRLFSERLADKVVSLNGDVKPPKPSPAQSAEIARAIFPDDNGEVWERPVFDTPPDPAGARWKSGLDDKPSSSEQIQAEIDKGGLALLGPGTYYLDKPLRLGKGKGLVGAGMNRTVLIAKSPDLDLVVSDGTAELVLCDLTLQGGRNGIYHHWSSGPNLQFTDVFVSHLTIRNMSDSGIKFENIYGWDNNFIDYINFVDCVHGFRQEADHFGNDRDPAICYMDKNVFYQCQFIRCEKALELHAFRQSQNNAWVNCLFLESGVYAARLVNHSLTMFANCDFTDNAGAPMMVSNGSLFLISCDFTARGSKAVDFVDALVVTAEGCTFERTAGASTVLLSGKPTWITLDHPDNRRNYDNRNVFCNNCTVNVPVGDLRNAVLFNNSFAYDKALNAKGVVVVAGMATTFLPGVTDPSPRLLRGSRLPSLLSSRTNATPASSKKRKP
ncbi:MAG TPA: right-handed parallel beta-helix repeat-containing protein [Planctomycetota bacterium]|nr:right-handed parallel beta-helix repeat-containing protein [Planctomycetota bacterium]